MKFIKTFESRKELSNVEDLLIEFEDSGEILKVKTYIGYNINILIELTFNPDIIGYEKLKIADKIIERLHRKYKNINIDNLNDMLQIDYMSTENISYSLYTVAKRKMNDLLYNLKIFNGRNFVGDECLYCGRNKDEIYFSYNIKNNFIDISYDRMYSKFINKFLFNAKDIKNVLKIDIENFLKKPVGEMNINGNTICIF